MPTIAAAAYKHTHRPAVRVSAQRSRLLRRTCCTCCSRCRASRYKIDPVAAEGARPAVHPARRSRAERQHLDRAPGRQHRREPVRRDLRRRHRRCGVRRTAAPTRPCSTCSTRSARRTTFDKFLDAWSKDKNDNFRLMGFGHRVYKNFDPRAKIIREMCHKVLATRRR